MPNQQHIQTLQQRIASLQATQQILNAMPDTHHEQLITGLAQLKNHVNTSLQVCQDELALRQKREQIPKDKNLIHKLERAAASAGIKIFRSKHKSFYSTGKIADPVAHCGLAPDSMQRAALRMDLDVWLANSCPSLAPIGDLQNERENCRRTSQRRLLVDAMLDTAHNQTDLSTNQFRNHLLQQLPGNVNPPQNVTWCEATNMISQSLNQGALPTFNQRLQAVQNNNQLANREKVVQAARLMRGCFAWKAKDDNLGMEGKDNDFRRWLNHGGPEPGEHATMNCWEAVYFAAFKAGVLTRNQILAAYPTPKSQGDASRLGYGAAQIFNPTTAVLTPGEVLFCDVEGEDCKHVVLSMGAQNGPVETMSLWTFETGGTFDLAPLKVVVPDNPIQPLIAVKRASPF